MQSKLKQGNCLELMKSLPDNFLDSVVTDPPYGLSKQPDIIDVMQHWINGDTYEHKSNGFMGKSWDSFVPGPEYWREVLRVLKPGGHAVVFAGSRTQDLMSIALRFAGFEIRETIMWVYSQGFPKSHDVSKAIDKLFGAEREVIAPPPYTRGKPTQKYSDTRKVSYDCDPQPITAPSTDQAKQWQGWGSALKPAYEPIILVRKPLEGTIAQNVLKWGCGGINIDDCRVEVAGGATGRWPANLCHDGSDEVVELFPETKSGATKRDIEAYEGESVTGFIRGFSNPSNQHGDSGSAARFFYSAKATKKDRGEGNNHPTVKPAKLMEWLVKMVTPENGKCLDPFMGSGTTGVACVNTGRNFIGIEQDEKYFAIAKERIAAAQTP